MKIPDGQIMSCMNEGFDKPGVFQTSNLRDEYEFLVIGLSASDQLYIGPAGGPDTKREDIRRWIREMNLDQRTYVPLMCNIWIIKYWCRFFWIQSQSFLKSCTDLPR